MELTKEDKLNLSFKSKKGKERLKRYGSKGWVIIGTSNQVQFSTQKGPWLLLEMPHSLGLRWIHQFDDSDFEITEVIRKD